MFRVVEISHWRRQIEDCPLKYIANFPCGWTISQVPHISLSLQEVFLVASFFDLLSDSKLSSDESIYKNAWVNYFLRNGSCVVLIDEVKLVVELFLLMVDIVLGEVVVWVGALVG